jgi:hypothetical protein
LELSVAVGVPEDRQDMPAVPPVDGQTSDVAAAGGDGGGEG